MKKKLYIWFNFILLAFVIIFSSVGFYQLYVELEDEIGLFLISLAVGSIYILIGMNIERLLKE